MSARAIDALRWLGGRRLILPLTAAEEALGAGQSHHRFDLPARGRLRDVLGVAVTSPDHAV